MPVIKQNKLLESNPNSIYSASKQVQTLSLRNMANNTQNPDTSIKSSIILRDNVSNDANDFLSSLDILDTNLELIVAYTSESIKTFNSANFNGMYNARRHLFPKQEQALEELNYNPIRGSGRPKGSKNKPKEVPVNQQTIPSLWNATSAEENMEGKEQDEIAGQGNEWLDFYSSFGSAPTQPPASVAYGNLSSMFQSVPSYLSDAVSESDDEAEAINASLGLSTIPMGTADDSSSDDENSTISSNMNSQPSFGYSNSNAPSDPSDPSSSSSSSSPSSPSSSTSLVSEVSRLKEGKPVSDNPLINNLVKTAEMITKMNIFFNGKIKKNINMLDKLEVQKIANESEAVAKTFNKIDGEYIVINVENGTIFYDNLLAKLNKLRTDVMIAVKSYAPQRQGVSQMMGGVMCGGSYHTSPIGLNAPIIPSVYSANVRRCPTKYLM